MSQIYLKALKRHEKGARRAAENQKPTQKTLTSFNLQIRVRPVLRLKGF